MASNLGLLIVVRVLQTVFTLLSLIGVLFAIIIHPFTALKVKKRTIPPQILLDPSLGTHEYVTANGIKFHYVSNGDKTKPLMLLLHGFPEFWYSWRYQLKEFCKDYHVVAVDMRGYGETDKPQGVKNYAMSILIEDVSQLIDALSSDGQCILAGHDWGGAIVWQVAAKHPEKVTRLIVLNCPHPRAFKKALETGWKQIFKSWYIFLFQTPRIPELMLSLNDLKVFETMYTDKKFGLKNQSNFTEEMTDAFKYIYSQKGALTPPINYYRNLFNNKDRVPKNIEVPVLLIWGEDDLAFDGDSVIEPHKQLCNDLTLHTIPNCSHFAQQDSPEMVNQYIREFLA